MGCTYSLCDLAWVPYQTGSAGQKDEAVLPSTPLPALERWFYLVNVLPITGTGRVCARTRRSRRKCPRAGRGRMKNGESGNTSKRQDGVVERGENKGETRKRNNEMQTRYACACAREAERRARAHTHR